MIFFDTHRCSVQITRDSVYRGDLSKRFDTFRQLNLKYFRIRTHHVPIIHSQRKVQKVTKLQNISDSTCAARRAILSPALKLFSALNRGRQDFPFFNSPLSNSLLAKYLKRCRLILAFIRAARYIEESIATLLKPVHARCEQTRKLSLTRALYFIL